jgi:hypothetical protein
VKTNFRQLSSFLLCLVAAASAWGYSFITDERPGGGALPIKWPAGTVAIQIKLGTNASGVNFDAAAQAASRDWNAVIGNLQITSTIAAPGAAAQGNGVNELVFADKAFDTAFDSRTLAITTTWSLGNERTQADIVFNTAFSWSVYDGARQSPVDLRRVALHELGHLLGLDHPDQATPPQSVAAVMNSQISGLDRISADDIAGAQQLYGPPGVPANDDFANAAALTLVIGNNAATATATGYNTNATRQTGEPAHVGTNAATHSVWWKCTAPTAGTLVVDTRGSYFDTVLGVYTGTAVNNLTTIGNNDDLQNDQTAHIQASQVSFTAVSGQTYYFAVDGWAGDSAGVTINLAFTASTTPPPTITTQPVSATVTAGGTASFSVTATNAVSYQWSLNNSPIAGATSATYSVSSAQAANAGSYFVTVTNTGGSVVSTTATLTVNTPPPVTPPTTPTTPSSSGGGGGGGAPSAWFYGILSLLAFARFRRRR